MLNKEFSQEGGRVAGWSMELPSGKIEFDPVKATRLGYDPKKFTHYKHFTDLIHPEDYERTMQAMRDHMDEKEGTYKVQYRILAADGTYHVYFDQGIIRERGKDGLKAYGVTLDIT